MYIYFPMYHNEISDSEPEVIETQYGCVTPESEEKCEKKDGLTGGSSVPTNAVASHTCKCKDKAWHLSLFLVLNFKVAQINYSTG